MRPKAKTIVLHIQLNIPKFDFVYFYRTRVFCYCLLWLLCVACRMLVSQPGVKPVSLALKVQHLNCWTTRNSLHCLFFFCKFLFFILEYSWLQCCISFTCTAKVTQLYISVYLLFFRFFSHIGHYRLLSRGSLCSIVGPQ